MVSRFQNVTDADVVAIKNAAANFSFLLAIYNLHDLQFMLQNVLTRSLTRLNTYQWPRADYRSHFIRAEFSVHSRIVANCASKI